MARTAQWVCCGVNLPTWRGRWGFLGARESPAGGELPAALLNLWHMFGCRIQTRLHVWAEWSFLFSDMLSTSISVWTLLETSVRSLLTSLECRHSITILYWSLQMPYLEEQWSFTTNNFWLIPLAPTFVFVCILLCWQFKHISTPPRSILKDLFPLCLSLALKTGLHYFLQALIKY